ncbi:unnamed protein product [Microthlaspi erraticum]|uniref:Thioredoxin domain-containing protein n=1 Tax=Microthlaspi erraticum TaxID=1685480 RepID=A0A6D2KWX1_9BRAS|nr:unnamed protein product [Microthlaspi erraticum]
MEKPILLLLVLITLTNTTIASSSSSFSTICHRESAKDYIFGFRDRNCPGDESASHRPRFASVTEGDDGWLQMATEMIDNKNKCDYVALLFYASWCPFSKSVRPNFDAISSLYSSIPHFAIEESSVKASTLSKYGVHGFPTIILLNSTMRVAYRGSRTLASLATFYSDVTGIKPVDETPVEKAPHLGNRNNNSEPENCPVSWARSRKRSPENLFRQETYLALATAFVLLRLLHLISPTMVMLSKLVWARFAQNMRLKNLLEHTVATYLKEPSVSSNLQEGAMSARAWASKSLATVSISDSTSSTRSVSPSQ